ncbi:Aldolase-type TIM barrel [Sesbania bispinosa]|nr:Aldolase-type TIM barrel [Sesbania bispinosa]
MTGSNSIKIKDFFVCTGTDVGSHDAIWDCGATGTSIYCKQLGSWFNERLIVEGKNPTLNSSSSLYLIWLYQAPIPIALNTALAQLGLIKPVFSGYHNVPLPVEKRFGVCQIG